jgi:tetratricopeptide (TPR) repeat protein
MITSTRNFISLLLLLLISSADAFTPSKLLLPVHQSVQSSSSSSALVVQEWKSTSLFANNVKKSNDAFLNSLEEIDGKEPSSESLATLRESASSSIANLLSSFSNNEKDLSDKSPNDIASIGDDATLTLKRNSTSTVTATPKHEWDVYVCLSKSCKERGASATLDTFQSLSPASVQIHPAILSKSKAKGPNIRCVQAQHPYKAFEVNNVNDIDKVYRILTKHMGIEHISHQARDCLKYTYEGNAYLEQNSLGEAIACYNSALATNYQPQKGILLLLRATAYLKRAFAHQAELRKTVSDLSDCVPDPNDLGRVYQLAAQHPSLAKPLFNRVLRDSKLQDKKFRLTKYRHGLYEYALLHAAQDSLRSTQLLPHHAKTWLRAGDALAELRKLKESALYYQKAMELDPTLRDRLEPVIERLERSQQFLEKAKGWYSSDTLRLVLDVAG